MSTTAQPSTPAERDRAKSRLRKLTRGAIVAASGVTVALGIVVANDHPGAGGAKQTTKADASTSRTSSHSSSTSGSSGTTSTTSGTGSSTASASSSSSTPTTTSSSAAVTSGGTSS